MKTGVVIRNALRAGAAAVYMAGHYLGAFSAPHTGPVLHAAVIFSIMLLFLGRRIPWWNYFLSLGFIYFYVVLFTTDYLETPAALLGFANKWWLYGALYTLLVTVFGVVFIVRHRGDRYQVIRTLTAMAVQVLLAFMLPFAMMLFGAREFYFSYLWPLKIEYFYPGTILAFPLPVVLYSFLGSLVLFPLLAFFLGKRFYCSWACGCGALAETFGDRWRHLSDKSRGAWRFERVSIYGTLLLAVITTAVVVANWAVGSDYPLFSAAAFRTQEFYGYFIAFALSGAAGVGFYPVLGTRVWCRFFCPMAALLGLVQKRGRFHIRVKRGMCISCGRCSTFCEMGIDVRRYAQNDETFTRAACVGCGMCARVCPRGVLRLENK